MLDFLRFLWYNSYIENDKKKVKFMTVSKPQNMEEALKLIELQQSKINHLQIENDEFRGKIENLKSRNDSLELLVHNMNEMLTKGRKMMFGRSSEQLRYVEGYEQLSFFNEAETESDASEPEPKEDILVPAHTRKAKRTKEELTESLPHKEVIVEFDGEDKKCDICGAELVCIGKEKLRSELNIVPAQIFVIDYYRNVYKCAKCEKETGYADILKPDAPVAVMKKSMASPATVAYTMQEKYQNGVTLFRQEQYWKSKGVELNRNTLANWIIQSSLWFKPMYEIMLEELLKEDIVHADETELRVLKRDGKPTNSMSRMWIFCSGKVSSKPMSLYKYHPTRSAKVVEEVLGEYNGYLQTDGYEAYAHAWKATRIGCWAHARRKWIDCLPKGIKTKGSKAEQALSIVEEIFTVEKSLIGMQQKDIYSERKNKIEPLLKKYWKLLEGMDAPKGSALYKARNYSLNQRAELEEFLADGRLELTNNRAERAVKPFVIARKNFLFSDTSKGADASALCFSIIESAKLNNLDVYGYLIYLLSELPKLGKKPDKEQLQKILPWSETLPEYCRIPKRA